MDGKNKNKLRFYEDFKGSTRFYRVIIPSDEVVQGMDDITFYIVDTASSQSILMMDTNKKNSTGTI